MNAKELALSWNDYLIETRRYLHRHPERSMHETETCRYILESLASFGIEGKVCGGTGVYADLGGKKPGKTIMLRADMDALPVEELNEIPYKSENPGMMHACGHDGHMAMLLTAARILKGMEEEIPGTVRVCFQPGEEVGLGALGMMKDGVLEGVDVIFGMHLWADVPTGKISVAPGPRMASCDEIRITVKGKGSGLRGPPRRGAVAH